MPLIFKSLFYEMLGAPKGDKSPRNGVGDGFFFKEIFSTYFIKTDLAFLWGNKTPTRSMRQVAA